MLKSYNARKTAFSLIAATLVLFMVFAFMPAHVPIALADEGEAPAGAAGGQESAAAVEKDDSLAPMPPAVSVIKQGAPEDDGVTPDDLFTGYAERQFDSALPDYAPMFAMSSAGDNLSGVELNAYNLLIPMIQDVAAGTKSSTFFELDVQQLYGKTYWTAADLGVSYIWNNDGWNETALANFDKNVLSIDDGAVVNALIADCPYDLYWFDKTAGYGIPVGYETTYVNGKQALVFTNNKMPFYFCVAQDYRTNKTTQVDDSDLYLTVNTSTGTRVNAAVTNAKGIANSAPELPVEKLAYFKQEICKAVEYDENARDGGVPYGDPWQLINVFDGDNSTNVVCEGYSKAFKYLCDLAKISNVDCILVTGAMAGGTGAGPHMWNIVNLDDGKNYLVDVTNCDTNTIGYSSQLFLATPTSGTASSTYICTCNGGTISYEYDAGTKGTFTTAELTLGGSGGEALSITTQPSNATVTAGKTATFKVTASSSSAITYQWQYSADGGKTWYNSSPASAKTATLSFKAQKGFNGRLYRCKLSDGQTTVYSGTAKLTVKSDMAITTQPSAATVAVGKTATFKVVATGTCAITYQWQYSTDGGQTWKNSSPASAKTATLTFAAQKGFNGRLYRCKLSDGLKTVYSGSGKLTVKSIAITAQPSNATVAAGKTATFKVAASSSSAITYQWQYSADGGKTWYNSSPASAKTATLSFAAQKGFNGRLYRCKLSDGQTTVYSASGKLTVQYVTITSQPSNATVTAGKTATFKVTATGSSAITYQWQYSADGGKTWYNSSPASAKTATLTFAAQKGFNGRLYRCKLSDGQATACSASAKLTVV